jgi:oxaloacetate decarboxylase alpha subunit
MLSNLESQLKEQGASDKIDAVLKEIAVVQKDAGYPPLVTPTSQIVGTQSVFNVLFGRYNRLSGEFQDLMAGKYGACAAPKNPDVVKKALESLKMEKEITHRPADDIPSEFDKLEEETKKLLGTNSVSVEDVLTYAMFPKVAPNFFKTRKDGPVVFKPEEPAPVAVSAPAPVAAPKAPEQIAQYVVNVNGVDYAVVVKPDNVNVNGVNYPVNAPSAGAAPAAPPAVPSTPAAPAPAVSAAAANTNINAPVAGTILRFTVAEGAEVKKGETVIILESMKMELEVKTTASGKIHFIAASGAQVASQQPIASVLGAVSAPGAASAPVPPPLRSAASVPAQAAPKPAAPVPSPAAGGTTVAAPVAGTVLRYAVNEGAQVNPGTTIIIIESMKMELEIKSTAAGKVKFLVPAGTQVASQQPIANIG